jgi:hypothetical protein
MGVIGKLVASVFGLRPKADPSRCPLCRKATKRVDAEFNGFSLWRCVEPTNDCGVFFAAVETEDGDSDLIPAPYTLWGGQAFNWDEARDRLIPLVAAWHAAAPKRAEEMRRIEEQRLERLKPVEYSTEKACPNKSCPSHLVKLEAYAVACLSCGGIVKKYPASQVRAETKVKGKRV